jgi:TonB family protein
MFRDRIYRLGLLVASGILVGSAPGAAPNWISYENPKVGFAFRYPSDLRVREAPEESRREVGAESIIEITSGRPATVVLRFIVRPTSIWQAPDLSSLRHGCRSSSGLQIDGYPGLVCVTCGRAACSWTIHMIKPTQLAILSLTREANLGRTPPAPHDGRFPILSIIRTLHFIPGGGTSASPATPVNSPERIQVRDILVTPQLVRYVRPVRPRNAKGQIVTGRVVIRATVSESGAVLNPKVLAGDPELAPAALAAVQQWRYKPVLLNGNPVEIVTEIEVPFNNN